MNEQQTPDPLAPEDYNRIINTLASERAAEITRLQIQNMELAVRLEREQQRRRELEAATSEPAPAPTAPDPRPEPRTIKRAEPAPDPVGAARPRKDE